MGFVRHARDDVPPGTGRNLVVQSLERAFGDPVVAVEKYDVFACRVFKRRVARRGAETPPAWVRNMI